MCRLKRKGSLIVDISNSLGHNRMRAAVQACATWKRLDSVPFLANYKHRAHSPRHTHSYGPVLLLVVYLPTQHLHIQYRYTYATSTQLIDVRLRVKSRNRKDATRREADKRTESAALGPFSMVASRNTSTAHMYLHICTNNTYVFTRRVYFVGWQVLGRQNILNTRTWVRSNNSFFSRDNGERRRKWFSVLGPSVSHFTSQNNLTPDSEN